VAWRVGNVDYDESQGEGGGGRRRRRRRRMRRRRRRRTRRTTRTRRRRNTTPPHSLAHTKSRADNYALRVTHYALRIAREEGRRSRRCKLRLHVPRRIKMPKVPTKTYDSLPSCTVPFVFGLFPLAVNSWLAGFYS